MIKRAFALRETELPEAEIDPLYERFITITGPKCPAKAFPIRASSRLWTR